MPDVRGDHGQGGGRRPAPAPCRSRCRRSPSSRPGWQKPAWGPRAALVSRIPAARQQTADGHGEPRPRAGHPGSGQHRGHHQGDRHGQEVEGRAEGRGVGDDLEVESGEEEDGEGPEVGDEDHEVGHGEGGPPKGRGRGSDRRPCRSTRTKATKVDHGPRRTKRRSPGAGSPTASPWMTAKESEPRATAPRMMPG